MKRLTYILLSALLPLAASCVQEVQPEEPVREEAAVGDKVDVTFTLGGDFYEYEDWGSGETQTKTFSEMTNAKRNGLSLRVYVFDQYGFFVEHANAKIPNPQETTLPPDDSPVAVNEETVFHVNLTKSNNPRRLHFVAVDTTGANFNALVTQTVSYGSEGTFMNGLSVANNTDAYWTRELTNSISESTHFRRIPLLRNFAKITVTAGTNLSSDTFRLTGFTLVNKPMKGSVAPFNNYNGGFAYFFDKDGEGTITRKTYKQMLNDQHFNGYQPRDVSWSNTTPVKPAGGWTAGDSGLTFGAVGDGNPAYLYETPNSIGDTKGKTFLIIKGDFRADATKPWQNNRYYKVDVIYKETDDYGMDEDDEGVATFYNLLRNFNYQVSIEGVSFAGYASAGEAATMPPTNNISASVLAEGVNNVSDGNGKRRLFVNRTYILYNSVGAKDDLIAKAITKDNANQNDNIKLFILSDPDGIIVNTDPDKPTVQSSTMLTDDYSPVKLKLQGLSDTPKTAVLRLYVEEEGMETLYRDITILLRRKYNLLVDCTDVVPKATGQTVNARLLIPDGINKNLFPLSFQLEPEEKTLYPDAASNQLPVDVGKSIVPGRESENSFQYVRTITYDEYSANTVPTKIVDGVKYRILDCKFLTNTANNQTVIHVQNQYFNHASGTYLNGNPVFQDGDLAVASIVPSDYYGAGNSYNYVEFTTVRNTGSVNITLNETDDNGTQSTTWSNYNLSTTTHRTANGDGTWTYRVPFLTKTFDGSSYSVDVTYPNDGDFTWTISGNSTRQRDYIFLPLGSFNLTNLSTGEYGSEERFKTGIIYGPIKTTDPANCGRVGFAVSQSRGTTETGARSTSTTGWTFADNAGYHIGVYRHPYIGKLTRDMKFRIYHPTSGTGNAPEDGNHTWREDWYVEVSIGELTDRHAIDFQAGSAQPNGLDNWSITLHAPVDGYDINIP